MTKTILKPGGNTTGKPGKPYIVKVTLLGYFAPTVETLQPASTVKSVDDVRERVPADEIEGIGQVFVDHKDEPIQLTLGDDRLPIGLWRSIEHMRKGEKSRIMIKPKYGYNSD